MNQFTQEIMPTLGLPNNAQDIFIKLSEKLNEKREYIHCKNIYDGR